MSFSSFGLHADLLRGVEKLGFSESTPIQRDAIPPALAGRDVLACAVTGSGKTAAFVLPILQRLLSKRRGAPATRALILTPTRELAAQIHDHMAELGAYTPVRAASIYGGVAMAPQETALRRGVEVIVATPGRLLDHFQYPYARLEEIEVLVLDEADRMLDMGFLPDVRRILAHLPRRPRQTLFFSATLPPPIVALSRELLSAPVTVNIERKAAPAVGITHAVYPVPENRKPALLLEILKQGEVRSALAFTRTKHRANRVADFLEKNGVEVARIHGNRSQMQRTQALNGFKDGRYRVLVATDIAARGIDIDALSHVINVDVPGEPDAYIHRVGRTARMEATGDAITFAAPAEESTLRAIERAIGARIPRKTVPGFRYEASSGERFEVPIRERIAAIRSQRSAEHARADEKATEKAERARWYSARAASHPVETPGGAVARGPGWPDGERAGGGGHTGHTGSTTTLPTPTQPAAAASTSGGWRPRLRRIGRGRR